MTATSETPTVPDSESRCQRCQATLPVRTTAGEVDGVGLCQRCLIELAMQPQASGRQAPTGLPELAELQQLVPEFELQSVLGRGGMGVVYRARHLKLDRLVAIKFLLPDLVADPAFPERFEREARALAKLDHPGIIGAHDFGKAGELFYLVLEFVDGANVRELLAQGQLSTSDVLSFSTQLCDALQFAHDNGVVHRDIKPENILIDQDGRVRIADFGLAKMVGQEPSMVGLTQTNQALGTPHYMAPEQVVAGDVDHRADLFSLGVVVYEMLTGTLPIGRFQPPSSKTPAARPLDAVVMKSLHNDPDQRYQQARQLKTDVHQAEHGKPPLQGRTERTAKAERLRTRRLRRERAASVHSSARPAREVPDVIWHSWVGPAVILVVTFMDWASYSIARTGAFANMGLGEMTGSIDAWNGKLLGMPPWLTLVLAVVLAVMGTLRALGEQLPRGAMLVGTSLGVLYCGFSLITIAVVEETSVGVGVVLATLTFLVWSSFEMQRIGTRGRS